MAAIQEITALLKTYPNTQQLYFQTEDGIHVENNPHIQSHIQPCSRIAKLSRSRLFLGFVHAQPYSNTGTRDQFGPGGRDA